MPSPPKGKVIATKNDPPALYEKNWAWQKGNLTGYERLLDGSKMDKWLTRVLQKCCCFIGELQAKTKAVKM